MAMECHAPPAVLSTKQAATTSALIALTARGEAWPKSMQEQQAATGNTTLPRTGVEKTPQHRCKSAEDKELTLKWHAVQRST